MKWFRLWTDILDDPKMSRLSDDEYRAFTYLLAMAAAEEKEGHIPYDASDISWRIRLPLDLIKRSLDKLLSLEIIGPNGNGWKFIHWEKRQFKSDDRSEYFRDWYQKKRASKHSNVESNVVLNNVEQIQNRTEQIQNIHQNRASFDALFTSFWMSYPKKIGKQAAQKAFQKVKSPKATLAKILASLEWQKTSDQWTKDDGKYIPNPATYLNQGRWEDEPYGNKADGGKHDNLFLRAFREENERAASRRMGGRPKPVQGQRSGKCGASGNGGVSEDADPAGRNPADADKPNG
jgi:hypothetical protein